VDDLAEWDLVSPWAEALLVVMGGRLVGSPEDLQDYKALGHIPGDTQVLADDTLGDGSASSRRTRVSQTTRRGGDDTRRWVVDMVPTILPNIRGCNTHAARPNSIPSRPTPMVEASRLMPQCQSRLRKKLMKPQ